jgi:hypothetical protein
MVASKLDTFGGMAPAVDNRLLPQHSAAHSENTWLYSGSLQGIPAPSLIRACTPGTGKVFRIPNNYVDADHLDDSVWMEFQDPDTDVTRALVIGDTYDRYYWASGSASPRYNTRARIAAASAAFTLGIPAPTKPTLTSSGGTGLAVSRAYLATWVSAYGEEGPAASPILLNGKVDDTWHVGLTAAASGDLGTTRNLTKTRIYRTVTGADGSTVFFLVVELPIATLTYDDVLSDVTVSANSILQSTNWIGPPTDLAGFIAMPNGILAGFRANEIWFCEPYRPHAWPSAYSMTVDFPIVGLGVTNQTLVVCTQAYPVTISGIHPASMAQSTSKSLEPCLSRGSILSTTEGVYYAGPNGLVFAGAGSISNITAPLVTKDKWQGLVTVPTLRAARLGTAYMAFGSKRAGMFDKLSFDTGSFAQEDFTGAYAGLLIDPSNSRLGFNLLSDTTPVTAIQNDPWSGETFVIKNDNLYRINLAIEEPSRTVYLWRSKIFQLQKTENLAAMRVYWKTPASVAATGAVPSTPANVEFPSLPVGSPYGVVRLYADDRLVFTRNLVTSGELLRPPSGFKASFWQIEFETYLEIFSVQIASSVKAMASA